MRTFTGTIAFSAFGVSPRESAVSRSAPATAARQTSFTVVPVAARISATWSKRARWPTRVRLGPIGTLRYDAGAGRRRSSPTANAARRTVSYMRAPPARGVPAILATPRAARSDSAAPPERAPIASLVRPGSGSGTQSGAGAGVASGVTSKRSRATSTAERPSTSAWWNLATMPVPPSAIFGAR